MTPSTTVSVMARRIRRHREERPASWVTLEAPRGVGAALRASGFAGGTVLLECLTLLADTSLSGVRVARELDRLVTLRGRPAMIVSDRRGSGNDPVDHFPEEGH